MRHSIVLHKVVEVGSVIDVFDAWFQAWSVVHAARYERDTVVQDGGFV